MKLNMRHGAFALILLVLGLPAFAGGGGNSLIEPLGVMLLAAAVVLPVERVTGPGVARVRHVFAGEEDLSKVWVSGRRLVRRQVLGVFVFATVESSQGFLRWSHRVPTGQSLLQIGACCPLGRQP